MKRKRRSKTYYTSEEERKAELQWLSEQVLYDLKREYFRAVENKLKSKALKIKSEIESVEKELKLIA